MRNIWLIIRREYLERVRTRSFLVLTLLVPGIMTVVMILPAKLATMGDKAQHLVVVTSTPQFGEMFRQRFLSASKETDDEDEAGSETNTAKQTQEPDYIIEVDSNPTEAERAVLLLADASGHGIGPALSVTQVRAMLRMAIRVGEDLPAIIRHLNAQLCADLTDGRFVSAWLGELDAKEQTLTGFSCGQGPLLYYRAAERTCVVVETDTVPFGCVEDLEVRLRPPIRMEPGDIFVALSDGVVDAERSSEGKRFGTSRVIDIVTRHCEGSATEVMTALRQALSDFTGATPADDDRTGVIVKRS